MMALQGTALVVGVLLSAASSAWAQTLVGALAVDERQGDQYGWAVDYETAAAARQAALGECGSGCSVVLTFERCAAYAADQDADSTAVGWAESYSLSAAAQQAALGECRSRGGGSGCIVRVWGCNGPVVEEGLGLDRAARRQVQEGLQATGFDPGGADGMFGPRTRSAIRSWQTSRGARATGYLDGASVSALSPAVSAAQPPSPTELEGLFWQSIVNSTNPADFEAYLAQFPNGVFRVLAQNRLSALGASGSVFRPDRTCIGQPAGASCWMEISGRPGCHVWNEGYAVGATVTWTGECTGGLAQGMGSLSWVWDGNEKGGTGQLQAGKLHGRWVIRQANGVVEEGAFVGGEENGPWVIRRPNGVVEEGPAVDGAQNGHWVIRFPSGQIEEGPLVDGERHGDWVIRFADGGTSVRRWVNGERGERVDRRPPAAGRPAGGVGSPASGSRASGAGAGGTAFGGGAGVDAPRRPGDVFRDCAECPEMVVLPGGVLAMGRYEVTVGEYRAFVSATGGTGDDSWRDVGFPQTDRHPVTRVSWDHAQEYVSWLSRRTGATYRLPTEAEWERAAAGSEAGCYRDRTGRRGTCRVGSYGTNAAGLSDMVGNLWEWTSNCWEGDCRSRVLRGGSWTDDAEHLRLGARFGYITSLRDGYYGGFRVSKTLD